MGLSGADAKEFITVVNAITDNLLERFFLGGQDVIVAEGGDRLLGFAAVDGQWLEQLYVDFEAQGSGVGRALFAAVKNPDPVVSFCSCTPATLVRGCFPRRLAVCAWSRATAAETRRRNRTAHTRTLQQDSPPARDLTLIQIIVRMTEPDRLPLLMGTSSNTAR